MTNWNEPINSIEINSPITGYDVYTGLTKREYFAALALQGILSNTNYQKASCEDMCGIAVMQADALIEALNKEKSE